MASCPKCEEPLSSHTTKTDTGMEGVILFERFCPVEPKYEVKTFGTWFPLGAEWELLSEPSMITTKPGGDHGDPLASEWTFGIKVYARRRVSPKVSV